MKHLIKLLAVIGCILLVGCSNEGIDSSQTNEEQPNVEESLEEDTIIEEPIDDNKEAINVYLFWGDGCHICENLMIYFDELNEKYGKYYNLVKYEVWYDDDNKNLMNKVGEELNQTYFAVPFLVIGDEVIVGYSSEKDEYIKNRIIECYSDNDYVDVVEKIKSSLN